jgi:hypothetical protein
MNKGIMVLCYNNINGVLFILLYDPIAIGLQNAYSRIKYHLFH